VYGALAVIVFWHTRSVWARTFAVVLAVAASFAVAWARAYQGMHFLSDVIAGIVLGVVSIYICARILGPPPDAVSRTTAHGDRDTDTGIGAPTEVAA
jgi:undecaprenyl-diphosphatase